jgi:ribosomal-protein-alanine N-acetyltransferase
MSALAGSNLAVDPAVDPARFTYQPMVESDIDQVVLLERSVYAHPWSRGNFLDALISAQPAWVLRGHDQQLLAYFLMMTIFDEVHLLNLAICAQGQGQGIGRLMLGRALSCARGLEMESMLLEVRPSNSRAIDLYQRHGFVQIGVRKGYYPQEGGQREDAIVMRLALSS